jgi:hypothetical protein
MYTWKAGFCLNGSIKNGSRKVSVVKGLRSLKNTRVRT